ncbi:unnamed protein product [Clavelina lepadiformis]|uniref:Pinin n=1 Tax=Clavelina lepadiformis TaxID=159417 RepID=A0ABP0F5B1_CLALP
MIAELNGPKESEIDKADEPGKEKSESDELGEDTGRNIDVVEEAVVNERIASDEAQDASQHESDVLVNDDVKPSTTEQASRTSSQKEVLASARSRSNSSSSSASSVSHSSKVSGVNNEVH